jgi:carbamoyl-phosphate synthase large subunit
VPIAREFAELDFTLYATGGTARILAEAGIPVRLLYKLREGRPNVLDLIKNGEMHFIINTPSGQQPRKDEVAIRSAAVAARVAMMTTLRGARASSAAIRALKNSGYGVRSLQEYQKTALED